MSETTKAAGVKFPSQAKWRENNSQKVWAQAALRSALKRGLWPAAGFSDTRLS